MVKRLLAAGVPCAQREWLVEWLSQPSKSLHRYMLFGTRSSGYLKECEDAREVVVPVGEASEEM